MSGKAKNGADWKYQIYFDPEADKLTGLIHKISDEELIDELSSLVDVNEKIEKVTIYKVPLSEYQLTSFLLYHNFVLFETHGWWWTIEKNSEGITIQRSKYIEAVKDKYRQVKRKAGISEQLRDWGRWSVGDLIQWLYEENELNKRYDFVTSNCQHFARKTFNYVAENKNY